MQVEVPTKVSADFIMTAESIVAYIQYEQSRGATQNALRRFKRFTASLYDWLPEDKSITKDRLLSWRDSLKALGYSSQTEQNYAKGVNRYLKYLGCYELQFKRGRAKDIAGQQFGYLTPIAPTGAKERRDYIWRCKCKCGKEVEYPATRLLTGNTLSCGCLRGENLKTVNKNYDGTSLRMSLKEKVFSATALSGYTGVTTKRNKWQAYITYKGQRISLGCYTKLEDAVKARAQGKKLVQMEVMDLLAIYEELHKNDPPRPNREQERYKFPETKPKECVLCDTRARRSNNVSGYPGISISRDKWAAKITYQKVTYWLGSYADVASAIAARQTAEQLLVTDSQKFLETYGKSE